MISGVLRDREAGHVERDGETSYAAPSQKLEEPGKLLPYSPADTLTGNFRSPRRERPAPRFKPQDCRDPPSSHRRLAPGMMQALRGSALHLPTQFPCPWVPTGPAPRPPAHPGRARLQEEGSLGLCLLLHKHSPVCCHMGISQIITSSDCP